MKPLVYYCRWQGAALRLRGRDETAVWGQLVFLDDSDKEIVKSFRFDLKSWKISVEEDGKVNEYQLDEKGTVQ